MTTTAHDDIEAGLRELFERQAESVSVDARAWDDPPMASVVALPRPRRSRPALAAITATAAAVALVVGIAAVGPGSGVRVAGQPGSPTPLHLSTRQVSLSADDMAIEAGGRTFTAGGSTVDLNSDPGTPGKYTTIELVWTENGTQMRLNIYFTSDGHDWWANEIRTYNGRSPGDWIEYTGVFFRSPLGTAFTGNVDLAAHDTHGHLRFSNLRLQPFLPPAACKNATTKYVLDPSYTHVEIPNGADGFGLGSTPLLDAASCIAVADPHAFTFDWTLAHPGVVSIDTYNATSHRTLHSSLLGADPATQIDLTRKGPGTTMLHVTAHIRATGKVVATTDIPVTVG
jgi:hypothetical protein